MCRSSSDENARGQVAFDELEDAAPALEPRLDEDARTFLDVVAGRLDEPRHLPQLRHDAPGPLGLGRVGKERLAGQTRADDVRVELRIPLPGAAPPRTRTSALRCSTATIGMFDLFDGRQRAWVDLMQTPTESGQRPDVGVDRRPAQVFEQVVVQVDAVEASPGSDRPRGDRRGSRRQNAGSGSDGYMRDHDWRSVLGSVSAHPAMVQ